MISEFVSHYKILVKLGEGGMSSLIQKYNSLIPRSGRCLW